MPGIVGFITQLPREQAEPRLKRMLDSMRHDASYASGTWIDAGAGVYVGWTARQNSFAETMPVCNERGDVVLVFSGEEYPAPGTYQALQPAGPSGDRQEAGYLVHRYEDDPAFPASLNGRFHGLVVDHVRGTAMLFNDRYGIHRLYFHEAKDGFYFSAEAKAILAVVPELRRINPRSLGEFVSCGCVLENRTLFENIEVLSPASAWVFRDRRLDGKKAYFDPRQWEEQSILEPGAYYEELREVFSRSLPRYFGGRQPVGMSLTGGLDTRMIMAWHKAAPGSLPCYSFGGMFNECQDVSIARRVARECGQDHQVIPVAESFLSRFSHYAERTVYLTDGCSDVSHAADLYVNEIAARIAPVRMTGNYGGEVLRRVRAFKPNRPSSGLFDSQLLTHIQSAAQTYAALIQGHPLSFAVFKQAPWHHYGLLALEQTQIALRSPFLDNELVQKVFRAPPAVLTNNDVSLRLIADGNTALRRIRTDRGLGGSRGPWMSALVRNALEFTFKADYAYDYGMPQWVTKVDHAFSALHLERLFLGRHKFYHFRYWYHTSLSAYVREILLDPRSLARPYLNRRRVEEIVRDHVKGSGNYTMEIHKLLTLELTHRLLLDSH